MMQMIVGRLVEQTRRRRSGDAQDRVAGRRRCHRRRELAHLLRTEENVVG